MKIRIIIIALLALISSVMGAKWFYFEPRAIANKTLTEFESAYYSQNIERVSEVTYKGTGFYESIMVTKKGLFLTEFNKFKTGFKILKTRRYTISSDSKIIPGKRVILLQISKTAKIDGRDRNFDEVELVDDNGKWKVLKFFFPDYIDY